MMKKIWKIMIDMTMLVLFIIAMGEKYTGNAAHEWIGVALFVIFIFHNILNRKWYQTLWKGKYDSLRILNVVINFSLILCMIGLLISGMMMSMTVFSFLGLHGGIFARQLHITSAYIGLNLIGLHLGLHIGAMVISLKKKLNITGKKEKMINAFGYALSILIMIYGVTIFIQNHILDKMLGNEMFTFFDETKTFQHFFEITILVISFSLIGYYIRKFIMLGMSKRKNKKRTDIKE